MASAGIGTGIHLAAEQLRQATGIEFVSVPYRGGGPSLADFLAGKVDFTFSAVPSIREHILAGKARGLATTRGRAPQLPDIPSMEEVGLGSVDSTTDMGLVVPAATPEIIVEKLRQPAVNAVKDPAFAQNLLERGFQPLGTTTEEYRAHIDREIEKWIRVIAAGNIKPE
jgi:tripartite-type tricarboxylate transporter receptor subunit TctC